MPYERQGIEFHQNIAVTGRVSKWGSRVLSNPTRCEYDLLVPSQRRVGNSRQMLAVRVTSYGEENRPGGNDYVRAVGIPEVKENRLMLMCFSKDIEILNTWISKKEQKNVD